MASYAIRTNYTKWSLPTTNGNENEMTLTKPVRLTSCKINWPSFIFFCQTLSGIFFKNKKLGLCSLKSELPSLFQQRRDFPVKTLTYTHTHEHTHHQTPQDQLRLAEMTSCRLRCERHVLSHCCRRRRRGCSHYR